MVAEIRAVGQAAIDYLQAQSPEATTIRAKLIDLEESLRLPGLMTIAIAMGLSQKNIGALAGLV